MVSNNLKLLCLEFRYIAHNAEKTTWATYLCDSIVKMKTRDSHVTHYISEGAVNHPHTDVLLFTKLFCVIPLYLSSFAEL